MSDETKKEDTDLLPPNDTDVAWTEDLKKQFPDQAGKYKTVSAALRSGGLLHAEAQELRRKVPKAPDEYPADAFPKGVQVTPEMQDSLKKAGLSVEQVKAAMAIAAPAVESAGRATITAQRQILMRELGAADEAALDRELAAIRDWGEKHLQPDELAKQRGNYTGVLTMKKMMLDGIRSNQIIDGTGSGRPPGSGGDVAAIQKELAALHAAPDRFSPGSQAKIRELTKQKLIAQGKLKK